jgi:glucose-6-phosphate 1-epimerase
MAAGWKMGARNGLDVVELTTDEGAAVIALQGAQVLSFAPRGGPDLLWVSERARWAPGAALRGGIPICFPWFGPHPTEKAFPAHGFARTRAWRLVGVTPADGGRLRAELALASDEATMALYPHPFEAKLAVTVGADLALAFTVANRGAAPLSFEVALHTYLAVSDVAAIAIEGLAGCALVDKVAGGERRREGDGPVRIAGEVDRVYDSAGPLTLIDLPRNPQTGSEPPAMRSDEQSSSSRDANPARAPLRIEGRGAGSAVVWNPAPAKTATLADMAPDGYRRFVCVETGAIADRRVTLAPGAAHELTVRYSNA